MENGVMNNIRLHCIGDSHTSFFTGYNKIQPEYPEYGYSIAKNIVTYRLGSPLAYNLSEFNSKTKSREKLFEILQKLDPACDVVLLSFGEVDCRAHIIRQAEKNNQSIESVVQNCVYRYLTVVDEIVQLGFNVFVWNAIPTAMGFEGVAFEYPYHGTYEQRNKSCIIFNTLLEENAGKKGFNYIGISDKIINEDLSTNEKFYFDKIHLNSFLLPQVIKEISSKILLRVNPIELVKIRVRYLLFSLGLDDTINYRMNRIITLRKRVTNSLKRRLKNIFTKNKKEVVNNIFIDKEFIHKFLPPNPLIIDCGAHVGTDSIELSRIKGSRIYAFEAISEVYNKLVENTKGIQNIQCFNLALSNETGSSIMYVSGGESDGSSSLLKPKEHLIDHPEVLFKDTLQVSTITLDEWAKSNSIEKIDMLWLDMQGAEQMMLAVSSKILPTVKIIHTEVSTRETYEGVETYQEFKDFLGHKGFEVIAEAIPAGYDMGNVLFVRK
ncbi:MAG: FkbM family methyltransferase [Ferruginibacter sp.]